MRSDKELQVIAAAYDVFFRYGFARTTMGDLASAAGMSRPALYLVFSGKEEVFDAVVDWMSDRMLATIEAQLDPAWPLARQLEFVLDLCVAQPYELIKSNPDAQDLLAPDSRSRMPALERAYDKLRVLLAQMLAAPVAASPLKVEAAELARTLLASTRGFKLVAADAQDLRRLVALQVRLLAAALAAPAPAARPSRGLSARRKRAAR